MLQINENREAVPRKAKKQDLVEVYGTGKSKFLVKDKAYTVHRFVGEKLVADGKAVADKAAKVGDKKDK